jgi:hypothetical protein
LLLAEVEAVALYHPLLLVMVVALVQAERLIVLLLP